MLSIDGLDVSIVRNEVLHGASLSAPQGAIVGIVGRNGAGKTTLMRAIMGLLPARAGRIELDGKDLTGMPAFRRARLGIGYMPEDRRLVPALSVEDNILVPAWAGSVANAEERLKLIYGLMPEVAKFAGRRALQLSGGQQKLVAMARALLYGTQVILLDEPFEGVAPALAQRLVEVAASLKATGATVLLSESDYTHSAGLTDKLYVIERGRVEERPAGRGTG